MKKYAFLFIAVFTLLLGVNNLYVKADQVNKEDVEEILQNGFFAQVSLSEEAKSLEEIEGILEPYFTDEMITKFMEENVVAWDNEGGYGILGSDFAAYYIPFFNYDEQTKMVIDEKTGKIHVEEFFATVEDGPTDYVDHYESVTLVNVGGVWKIDQISYDSEKIDGGMKLTGTDKPTAFVSESLAEEEESIFPITQVMQLLWTPQSMLQSMGFDFLNPNVSENDDSGDIWKDVMKIDL